MNPVFFSSTRMILLECHESPAHYKGSVVTYFTFTMVEIIFSSTPNSNGLPPYYMPWMNV